MNSLVSLVLPTYNRAHVLPYAIRSILQQTYKNFELIIVDDNSPDDTAAVVKSFDDDRIKYVKNDPNLKLPRALNKGFSIVCGEYLTWTSDDNIYGEQAIEKMVDVLKQQKYGFVYADYFEFSELDKESGLPLSPRHEKLPGKQQFDKANRIGACFMYTREVYEKIGLYDPALFLVEDYDYFMRIAQEFNMTHIAQPLYYFRRDEDTLYYSRFSEVKASDILVRYKNRLINKNEVVDAVVALVLRNIEKINNPVLRFSYGAVQRISYRLTNRFKKRITLYFRHKLYGAVMVILKNYDTQKQSFSESKDQLCELMKGMATIEYK